jgi:hypothetical protein
MPFRAAQRHSDRRTAVGVPDDGGRPVGACQVPVAPGQEGQQDRDELAAGLTEPVLVPLARARLTVGGPLEQAVLGQAGEPARQDVAGDAQVVRQLVEAADAVGDVAQHQQRPPVPDERERPGDRARFAVVSGVLPHAGHSTPC